VHSSRWVIISGSALAALALFAPFLSAPLLETVNGIEADAWPAAVLLALPFLAALTGDRAEGFHRITAIGLIILTDIAVVFAVFKLVDAVRAARTARDLAGAGSAGFGPWLLLAATVIVLAGCVMSLSRRVR
jgi:hypothetical protein